MTKEQMEKEIKKLWIMLSINSFITIILVCVVIGLIKGELG